MKKTTAFQHILSNIMFIRAIVMNHHKSVARARIRIILPNIAFICSVKRNPSWLAIESVRSEMTLNEREMVEKM